MTRTPRTIRRKDGLSLRQAARNGSRTPASKPWQEFGGYGGCDIYARHARLALDPIGNQFWSAAKPRRGGLADFLGTSFSPGMELLDLLLDGPAPVSLVK